MPAAVQTWSSEGSLCLSWECGRQKSAADSNWPSPRIRSRLKTVEDSPISVNYPGLLSSMSASDSSSSSLQVERRWGTACAEKYSAWQADDPMLDCRCSSCSRRGRGLPGTVRALSVPGGLNRPHPERVCCWQNDTSDAGLLILLVGLLHFSRIEIETLIFG